MRLLSDVDLPCGGDSNSSSASSDAASRSAASAAVKACVVDVCVDMQTRVTSLCGRFLTELKRH